MISLNNVYRPKPHNGIILFLLLYCLLHWVYLFCNTYTLNEVKKELNFLSGRIAYLYNELYFEITIICRSNLLVIISHHKLKSAISRAEKLLEILSPFQSGDEMKKTNQIRVN